MNNISVLKKDCCGCNACEQLCPKNCISFEKDNEGFMYPKVDESKCVECGVCTKHCPILSEPPRGENPLVYAAKFIQKSDVLNSSSGGIFVPFARDILRNGGIVFGCAFDENLVAKHIAVESKDELYKLQSSKYVQSDIRGIYSKVKSALRDDRYVLFSGTGCQVAGLKSFLGKDYPKLFTVDIVCHGVPSPDLFSRYLDWLGKKMGGKVTEYNFRSKDKCGWDLYYKARTDNKVRYKYGFFDPYYNAFLNRKIYREGCYNCSFANAKRVSEITLADYWGIQRFHPEFFDESGVSLVLINNPKGEELWSNIKNDVSFIPSDIEKASVMNGNLVAPSKRPECRNGIYDGMYGDFDKYISSKLRYKVSKKMRIKKMIPHKLKQTLKKLK